MLCRRNNIHLKWFHMLNHFGLKIKIKLLLNHRRISTVYTAFASRAILCVRVANFLTKPVWTEPCLKINLNIHTLGETQNIAHLEYLKITMSLITLYKLNIVLLSTCISDPFIFETQLTSLNKHLTPKWF